MGKRSCIFTLLLFLITVICHSESGLRVNHQVGFNGIFQSDGLVPLRIFVGNEGSDIRGSLVINTISIIPGKEGESTVYRQDIELPRNSYKSYSFILPADQMDEIHYSVQNKNGEVLYETTANPKAVKGLDNIILVLSRSVSFDFLSRPGGGRKNRIIYMHPDIMPDSWLGYSQTAALVLHNIQASDLSARQLKSIDKWVKNGGTLIIIGGAHFNRNNFEILRGLLPVSLNRAGRDMVKINKAVFKSRDNKQTSIAAPELASMNIIVKDGSVLGKSGSLPLVVTAKRGAGSVIFSAVDFTKEPLKSWPERNSFWYTVLPEPRQPRPAQLMEKDFNNKLLVNSISSETKNSHSTLYYFLISLPLLIAILFLYITGKKSIVPVILFCLLLSGIALFVYQTHLRPSAAINRCISILQMKSSTIYGSSEHHLLLAAARESDYSLYIPEGDIHCILEADQGTINSSSSSTEIQDIHIPKWKFCSYQFNMADTFSYSAALDNYGTGKQYTVKNLDSVPIESAFFIYKGHIYPAGDLAPGESTDRIFYGINSASGRRPADGWKTNFEKDPFKFEKIEILKSLFEYNRFDYLFSSQTITFAGWISRHRPELITNVPFENTNRFSLLLIPLDIHDIPEIREDM